MSKTAQPSSEKTLEVMLFPTQRARKSGQSIVELAVALMALIPIVLVVFDLAVIVIGVQINDSTCREAARVAASGKPSDAKARAAAVVARANQRATSMLSNFVLITPITMEPTGPNPPSPTQQETQLAQFGGPIQGSVTIQTQVDIRPFVVQFAYSGKSPLVFRAKQSFPFTYIVPNQAQPNGGTGGGTGGWGSGPGWGGGPGTSGS